MLIQVDAELFVYVRRWQSEAARFAAGLVVCMIALWLVARTDAMSFPLLLGFMFGAALFGFFVSIHLRRRLSFKCKLTRTRFSIEGIAVASLGDEFDIAVEDIVRIEHASLRNDDENWYVTVTDGRRLRITSNYGNPVAHFMSRLLALRQDLTVVQSTDNDNRQSGGLP